jgi:hypothetical protein
MDMTPREKIIFNSIFATFARGPEQELAGIRDAAEGTEKSLELSITLSWFEKERELSES